MMPCVRFVIAMFVSWSVAAAGEPSKEECVEAHSRGQDAKERASCRSRASCS